MTNNTKVHKALSDDNILVLFVLLNFQKTIWQNIV